MHISDVLAAKGRSIITLWTTHCLADAMRLFDERKISSIVIVDPERRPLGLLTDRDAVHALARHGPTAFSMSVTSVMNAPAPCCAPDTTVAQALARMTFDRLRHLVVMADENMTGIVSIGDLVKVRLDDAEVEGRVLRELALGRMAAQ